MLFTYFLHSLAGHVYDVKRDAVFAIQSKTVSKKMTTFFSFITGDIEL